MGSGVRTGKRGLGSRLPDKDAREEGRVRSNGGSQWDKDKQGCLPSRLARPIAQWAFTETARSAGVRVRPEAKRRGISEEAESRTLRMSHVEKGWGCSVQRGAPLLAARRNRVQLVLWGEGGGSRRQTAVRNLLG